jgi:hypothetical protein
LTLGAAVSAIFTQATGTGPTLIDTGVLFNATAVSTTGGHANLLTAALSAAAWQAVKLAMRKQTEVNSGERLGALTSAHCWFRPTSKHRLTILPARTRWTAITRQPGGAGPHPTPASAPAGASSSSLDQIPTIGCGRRPNLFPTIGLGFRYITHRNLLRRQPDQRPHVYERCDARQSAGSTPSADRLPGLHKNNVS